MLWVEDILHCQEKKIIKTCSLMFLQWFSGHDQICQLKNIYDIRSVLVLWKVLSKALSLQNGLLTFLSDFDNITVAALT